MADINRRARLRNACDSCHKLKRRCTGSIPCESCALLGSSCSYSVAARLGRPRGSKSRRKVDSRIQPGPQSPRPSTVPRDDAADAIFDDMLYLDFDSIDPASTYDLSVGRNQNSSSALNVLHADSPESIGLLLTPNASDLGDASRGNDISLSIPSTQLLANHQQQHQQQRQRQQKPQEEQQNQCEDGHHARQQLRSQSRTYIQTQTDLSRLPSHEALTCQCFSGLSSLLHGMKRTGKDESPPARLDTVLASLSDTLSLWSEIVACGCYQSRNDNGETLLLASLCMRRVALQLRRATCDPQLDEYDEPLSQNHMPQIHIGICEITGSDRTTILGVMRTIAVRKLDSALRALQSLLQTSHAQLGLMDAATLNYIESILNDSIEAIA